MKRYAELLSMLSQKIKNPDELISNIIYALELADTTILTQTYIDEERKRKEKETSWYIK